MLQSTKALLILAAVVIMFITEKIPLYVTALLGMLAMGITGILSFTEAFSGFGNTAVMMIIGMSIISGACESVGLSKAMRKMLNRISMLTEKTCMIFIFIMSAVLASFMNGMIVVTILAPIIDGIVIESDGKITRKGCYFPMAFGAVLGGQLTCFSTSAIISASGLLAESSYGRGFSAFQTLPIGIWGIVIGIIFYFTVGYRLQKECEDENPENKIISKTVVRDEEEISWRFWLVFIVMAACVLACCFGCDMGAVAICGACVVILFKCIEPEQVFQTVSWETIFTVAASLGFALGISHGGAAQIITDFVLDICGPIAQSPYGMCIVMMFLGTILSNFISNTAAVVILTPIAITIAETLGESPVAFAVSCALGVSMALATPICTATVTYTVQAGYSVRDYIKVGGLLNLLVFIAEAAALYFMYF